LRTVKRFCCPRVLNFEVTLIVLSKTSSLHHTRAPSERQNPTLFSFVLHNGDIVPGKCRKRNILSVYSLIPSWLDRFPQVDGLWYRVWMTSDAILPTTGAIRTLHISGDQNLAAQNLLSNQDGFVKPFIFVWMRARQHPPSLMIQNDRISGHLRC